MDFRPLRLWLVHNDCHLLTVLHYICYAVIGFNSNQNRASYQGYHHIYVSKIAPLSLENNQITARMPAKDIHSRGYACSKPSSPNPFSLDADWDFGNADAGRAIADSRRKVMSRPRLLNPNQTSMTPCFARLYNGESSVYPNNCRWNTSAKPTVRELINGLTFNVLFNPREETTCHSALGKRFRINVPTILYSAHEKRCDGFH